MRIAAGKKKESSSWRWKLPLQRVTVYLIADNDKKDKG